MVAGQRPEVKAQLSAAASLESGRWEGEMFGTSMNMISLCSKFLKVCPEFCDKCNRTVPESYFSFYYCFNLSVSLWPWLSHAQKWWGDIGQVRHSFGFQTSHVMLLHYWDLLFMPDNIFWLFYHLRLFILHLCILSLSLFTAGSVRNFSKQK